MITVRMHYGRPPADSETVVKMMTMLSRHAARHFIRDGMQGKMQLGSCCISR